MPEFVHKHERLMICVLLVLITVAVYFQVGGHDFINFDDSGYVFENKHVKAGLTPETVRWAFTTFTESNWHPLTWLSHALDCTLYGTQNPGGHHVTGLIFHLLNVLLVFFVFNRMTGYPWRSAFVAALFAIHPLHVESVAWVAERKDVLSTFFWLLTMLAYVYYVESPKARRYLLVIALFVLGLMAKPMLVSLPLVLLLMDYWPLGRMDKEKGATPVSKLVLEKIPLLILTLGSCVVTYIAQKPVAVQSLDKFPFSIRVENAAVSYATYLWKTLAPYNMSVFYPHPGKNPPPSFEATAAFCALLLVGISIAVVMLGRSRRYLIAGWLWYIITLVPVIGLVQVGSQAMADRYTYVSLLGIFVAIAWGVPELFARTEKANVSRQARRAQKRQFQESQQPSMRLDLAIPAVIAILILMPITYVQASYWRNTETLFRHTISIFPNDAAAHTLVAQELGDGPEAIEGFRRAVEANPKNVEARFNLGVLLAKQKPMDEMEHHRLRDEAIEHFQVVANIRPKYPKVQKYLGNLLTQRGRIPEADQHLQEAIRQNPNDPQAYCYMALVKHHENKIAESEQYYRRAITLKPDYSEAHGNLSIILYMQGRYAESWKEVHLCRQYGGDVKPEVTAALTQVMPEPSPSSEQ